MNLNDAYWGDRITVRQELVGSWILGRDPANTYTAQRFLLFKPDGKCCTMLTINEKDALLLHGSIRSAMEAARTEGFKAGQEAMRERTADYAETYDGSCLADGIRSLPIEEPTA